jgi:uncharacterized RDD family membrane protein YckC
MDTRFRPSVFKRFLAIIVDFIILGIIGFITGLFLEDFYISLGVYGTLVGSAITILYFGILQSKIGEGQSVGKMAIKAKVTDLNGELLSIDKSLLRALIIYFPIMNAGIFTGGKGMVIVVALMVFVCLACIYFVLVNKSRRSLHDILLGSVVVYDSVYEVDIEEKKDTSLLKIVPLAVLFAILLGTGVYQTFSTNELSQLLVAKEKIEKQEGVLMVNEVSSNTTTISKMNEASVSYSSIQMTVRIDNEYEAADINSDYFDDFYKIIRTEIPESKDVDFVIITLYYGYNIGIAHKTRSVTKRFES